MQQKAHQFPADGTPGQSIKRLCPQTEKTGNDLLSGMRGGHEDRPDDDPETPGQKERLSHISEQREMVM